MPSQKCPLCQEMANFSHPATGSNQKIIQCNHCKSFVVVSPVSENIVSRAPLTVRTELSSRSKASKDNELLVIWYEDVDGKIEIRRRYDKDQNWI